MTGPKYPPGLAIQQLVICSGSSGCRTGLHDRIIKIKGIANKRRGLRDLGRTVVRMKGRAVSICAGAICIQSEADGTAAAKCKGPPAAGSHNGAFQGIHQSSGDLSGLRKDAPSIEARVTRAHNYPALVRIDVIGDGLSISNARGAQKHSDDHAAREEAKRRSAGFHIKSWWLFSWLVLPLLAESGFLSLRPSYDRI